MITKTPSLLSLQMRKLAVSSVFMMLALSSVAVSRFPKPEFESSYKYPTLVLPQDSSVYSLYISLGLLIVAMLLTAYFTLVKRSRKAVFFIMLFSLCYFGFYKQGCLCAIGSLQNVTLALVNPDVAIPFAVVLVFLSPLIISLFFGRVFCAAVCPLGAIQDMVAVFPKRVPQWLEHCLGMIPYLYFALAVLYAATNSAFVICRYDPFVAFFRMNGSFAMIVIGIILLVIGMFVARPYCRFICPYSVLLRWMSFFAKYHVSITPDDCIQCRLCENACPFNAIKKPLPDNIPESRKEGRKRLTLLILLIPVVMLVAGWSCSRLDFLFAKLNPTVKLAEQIKIETKDTSTTPNWEVQAFYVSGKSKDQLVQEAATIKKQFHTGGWLMGAFMGLVVMLKLISLSIRNPRKDYIPDHIKCISCARCFSSCPTKD